MAIALEYNSTDCELSHAVTLKMPNFWQKLPSFCNETSSNCLKAHGRSVRKPVTKTTIVVLVLGHLLLGIQHITVLIRIRKWFANIVASVCTYTKHME